MQEKKKYLDRMAAGQAIKGTVLYKDLKRDLALVQLDKVPPDTPALPMSRTRPRVGEKVIAIGNPEREKVTFSTTEGVLRAVDVRDALSREPIDLPRVKTVTMTNPVFPGDSGGPVIDKRGFLVAVVESIRSDDRTQKVNGAIDVTEVRAFLTEKKIKLTELAGDKDK